MPATLERERPADLIPPEAPPPMPAPAAAPAPEPPRRRRRWLAFVLAALLIVAAAVAAFATGAGDGSTKSAPEATPVRLEKVETTAKKCSPVPTALVPCLSANP